MESQLRLKKPQKIFISHFLSPIGKLQLAAIESGLISLAFEGSEKESYTWLLKRFKGAEFIQGEDDNYKFHKELDSYFKGDLKEFTVTPLLIVSEFSRSVLNETSKIPFGHTVGYLDIAKAIGKPTASRAVGRALALNPIPIIVPCHRVIGSDGRLVGFGGGLRTKQWLISHEERYLQ